MNHLRAILALPFTVLVIIPTILLSATGTINIGWSLAMPLSFAPPIIGLFFIGAGLTMMYKTIALFARVGKGTLAPWEPPQKLVVHGIYRHVRNPMITGVFAILLGETILSGSRGLLIWFGLFVLINAIYIPFSEEPRLARRFGEDYLRYKRNVPRWIPRVQPWDLS
ncbi:MAG: isoprenylcysteine carboxylmethyltransferase family protein [Chloroflexi bacterium]|nr:isoprenylcysteine carboxylmethyltransferase family protein [Chloroflexota bacterium]